MNCRSVCLILALATAVGFAGDEVYAQRTGIPDRGYPNWQDISAAPVDPDRARDILFAQAVERDVRDFGRTETESTPEIQELARALQYDPLLIYNYVRNHFDYVPTFGSSNGATATYYAGRGNDFDLVSLFIALVRESGYTANYVVGNAEYAVPDLARWISVSPVINIVGDTFARGGVPVGDMSPNIGMTRVWAQVEIDKAVYTFDPAMKWYTDVVGIDLGSAMDYDRTELLTGAASGSTSGTDSIEDVNEAGIRGDLTEYSMNLADYIETHMPEADVAEVVGGRTIIPEEFTSYPTALPHALTVWAETVYSEIPQAFRHTVNVQLQGIDETLNTYDISGKRICVFFDGPSNAPVLYVDGAAVATGSATAPGNWYPMQVSIDHAYAGSGGTYADQTGYFYPYSGSQYALFMSLESCSRELVTRHSRALSRARFSGAGGHVGAGIRRRAGIDGLELASGGANVWKYYAECGGCAAY